MKNLRTHTQAQTHSYIYAQRNIEAHPYTHPQTETEKDEHKEADKCRNGKTHIYAKAEKHMQSHT